MGVVIACGLRPSGLAHARTGRPTVVKPIPGLDSRTARPAEASDSQAAGTRLPLVPARAPTGGRVGLPLHARAHREQGETNQEGSTQAQYNLDYLATRCEGRVRWSEQANRAFNGK